MDLTKNIQMEKEKRSIRNLIISPKEQLALAFFGIFILFITLAAQAIFFTRYFSLSTDANNSIGQFSLDIDSLISVSISSFVFFLFLGGTSFFLIAVFYTHKIYGPLYAIRIQLKKVLNNEPCMPLKGREGDKVHDLFDLVNQVVDGYKKNNNSKSS